MKKVEEMENPLQNDPKKKGGDGDDEEDKAEHLRWRMRLWISRKEEDDYELMHRV